MGVKEKQCLLYILGYYKGAIDGDWGPQSKSATERFQQDFGFSSDEVDGVCGPKTEQAMRHAVCYGMSTKNTEENSWKGKYWSREEFRCQCGGKYCDGFPAEPDEDLVLAADDVRIHFGRPGHRSSGLRCKTWNAIQGGVSNSRHLTGKALDFRIEGHNAAEVLAYVNTLPKVRYAYDIDGTYVHMDVE